MHTYLAAKHNKKNHNIEVEPIELLHTIKQKIFMCLSIFMAAPDKTP